MAKKIENCWQIIDRALTLASRAKINLIISGPPAVAKSSAAASVGLLEDEQIEICPCHEDMLPDALVGHYLIEPSASGHPSMRWHDGHVIRAWRAGSRLVLDEADRLPPSCRAALQPMLELSTAQRHGVTLQTGERVFPAAGFHCVATTNCTPQEIAEGFGPALMGRYVSVLVADRLRPQVVETFPREYREAVRATAAIGERSITPRQWRAFLDLQSAGANENESALIAFGPRAEETLATIKLALSK